MKKKPLYWKVLLQHQIKKKTSNNPNKKLQESQIILMKNLANIFDVQTPPLFSVNDWWNAISTALYEHRLRLHKMKY